MSSSVAPVMMALDVDDVSLALQLAKKVSGHCLGTKVGPRISFRGGAALITELKKYGLVFFDHKFFDIPSTMVASCRIAAEMGADWVTVHALAGPQALKELVFLETELRLKNPNFRILAVTLLTSFSADTLPAGLSGMSIGETVMALVQQAYDCGVRSFVCSPEEVKSLSTKFEKSFFVVPGIRPQGSHHGDQTRVATPEVALKAGASALVIGRPLLEAKDPVGLLKNISHSL